MNKDDHGEQGAGFREQEAYLEISVVSTDILR
jgi:hypothetical protein